MAFSKALLVTHAKTRAIHENAEASKRRGLVLTMRGVSKTAGCDRYLGLIYATFFPASLYWGVSRNPRKFRRETSARRFPVTIPVRHCLLNLARRLQPSIRSAVKHMFGDKPRQYWFCAHDRIFCGSGLPHPYWYWHRKTIFSYCKLMLSQRLQLLLNYRKRLLRWKQGEQNRWMRCLDYC